jgi:hypothetical protein
MIAGLNFLPFFDELSASNLTYVLLRLILLMKYTHEAIVALARIRHKMIDKETFMAYLWLGFGV